MAVTMTEEQKELVQLVRDVARNEVMPHVAAADEAGECPRELFQWGFDMGLHMVEIPEEFGGMGLDYETCAMIFEELAWVDAAYADTFVTNFVAFRNIHLHGTPEQAQHFVELTENNGFAAFCLSEACAGSDVAAMRTTAVRDGDEYVINGTKTFITNGSISSAYVVFAKTDPEGWAEDKGPKVDHITDVVLYEMHHRDMSMSPTSGIVHKGKFLALTEPGTTNSHGEATGIDHLKELASPTSTSSPPTTTTRSTRPTSPPTSTTGATTHTTTTLPKAPTPPTRPIHRPVSAR